MAIFFSSALPEPLIMRIDPAPAKTPDGPEGRSFFHAEASWETRSWNSLLSILTSSIVSIEMMVVAPSEFLLCALLILMAHKGGRLMDNGVCGYGANS